MASLEVPEYWVEPKNKALDVKTLNRLLTILKSKFSEELYQVVRECVLLNENERPDGIALRKIAWLYVTRNKVSRVDRSKIDVPT